MKIVFSAPAMPSKGFYVVGVGADGRLGPSAKKLDQATNGTLTRAIKASRFKGKARQTLHVLAPAGTGIERVVLIGLGADKDANERWAQDIGGAIFAAVSGAGFVEATVAIDAPVKGRIKADEMAADVAFGAKLRSYRFDKYKTKKKNGEDKDRDDEDDKSRLATLNVLVANPAKAKVRYADLEKVAEGVFFTRDLVSEPPNVLYPETLAREARSLTRLGVRVEVLGVAEMRKLGMNALLGVGQGSAREPKLVVMEWRGARSAKSRGKTKGKDAGPLAFVGKGVTFDTGGISIKPAAGMEDMKWDMGGAGAVIGLMRTLAGRKAKIRAVGVVGLVENMPDGNAQRPGDIVKSMSGQTIEILNTDAEGRLVLADALWYCKTRFNPRFMVDLATLTGAIIVSLGHEKAGLFSNDDSLAKRLSDAGEATGEKLWRLPLGREYDKQIDSDVADMKNIGAGRGAGSITAAQFLQRFVDKTPWAHLDIAGVAWATKDSPICPKGGTGFGVRLLDRLVADHYEGK